MGTHWEQRKYPPKENASVAISHQNPKEKKTGPSRVLQSFSIGALKLWS
jgi:hypothetical protein